jgi:hypothetical protein
MAERFSEMGSRYQLSKMLTLEPITGSETDIAKSHEINRQSAVKEILVHVFFMAKFGLIERDLAVGEAHAQYFSSTGGHQAAHCSPGQIFYQAKTIQEYLEDNDELLVAVDNLFGRTDGIDAVFNIADSRAEENGLREALRVGCINAASAAQNARFNRAIEIYPYISTAFGAYKSFGVRGFQNATARQRALMRRRDPADVAARERTIAILGVYQDTLLTADDSLETVVGLFPEDIWKQYKVFR